MLSVGLAVLLAVTFAGVWISTRCPSVARLWHVPLMFSLAFAITVLAVVIHLAR